MADSAVVGILRAMLIADTASFDTGMRKAVTTTKTTEKAISGLGTEVKKLTPQAERMVKAFQGDKLLYQANNLVSAVTKMGGVSKLTESELKRVNGTLNEAIAKYKAMGQTAPKALLDMQKATSGAVAPTQFLTAKMVALGAATGTMVAQLAGRAIRGVIEFGKEAFRSAGAIVDLSSKTGLGTRTIQEMQFVAEQTGTTLDAMTDASFKLGVRIAGGGTSVAGAMRELGLDLQRIQAMRPDQMWDAVVTALGKVESATERNRLGTILFGRSFASVAGAVSEGYRNIANQASVATDAQLRELERLGDEWTKFRKNLVTGFAAAMGEIVLRNRVTSEVMREQVAKGTFGGEFSNEFKAEVERRLRLGLSNQRTTDIKLLAEETAAQKTYAQQLAAVRAELAKLTPAQRAEIDAALELGRNTDELEDKFGLQEGTLRLYVAAAKDADKASRDLAKSQKELAKELEETNRRWLDILGSIEAAQIKADSEFRKAERGDGSSVLFPGDVGLNNEEENLDHWKRILDAKDKADADYRQHQNFIGERLMEDEAERLSRAKAFRDRYRAIFSQGLSNIGAAATSGLFSMFLPTSGAGKEAREEYERLRKSGTASAEAITQAFRRMKQEQSGFFDRFKGWAASIFNEFKRLVDNMLGTWVNELLAPISRSLARFLTGLIPGGGSLLGTAGSGALAGAIGLGGGAAVGGLGTLAGAPIFGASGALVGTAGVSASTAGAGAAGGAAAAGGAGIGATIGALATNPVTIAAAAALGAFFLIRGAGNTTLAGFGGGHLAKRLADHRASVGGFAPPNLSMPSMTGVSLGDSGGSSTAVADTAGRGWRGGERHVHFHLIDAKGVRDLVGSPTFTNEVGRVFENNTGFVASRVGRALNR